MFLDEHYHLALTIHYGAGPNVLYLSDSETSKHRFDPAIVASFFFS